MNFDKLKEHRKAQKLTILQMQKKTGINRNMLSMIERGYANPTIKTLECICKVLGLKIELL